VLKFCIHDCSKDNSIGLCSRTCVSSRCTVRNYQQHALKFKTCMDLSLVTLQTYVFCHLSLAVQKNIFVLLICVRFLRVYIFSDLSAFAGECFVSLVRSFYLINHHIHFNPFPLFNVLKVNNDKLSLPLSALAVVYGFLLRWENFFESLDPLIYG